MRIKKLLLSLALVVGVLTGVSAQLDYAAKPYIPPADYRLQVIYVGNFKPSTLPAHDNNERWDWVNANFMRLDTNIVRFNNSLGGGSGPGITYTAGNGLTLASTEFQLGGTLSAATTVDINNKQLNLRNVLTGFGMIMNPTDVRIGTGSTPKFTVDQASNSLTLATSGSTLNMSNNDPTWTGLSIDDTETYLMSIDPSSGLLSRRSVSSLPTGGGGGGGTVVDSMVYQTCPYNDTTYITVGDLTKAVINVNFNMYRAYGSLTSKAGEIIIQYDEHQDTVTYSVEPVGLVDIGTEIQATKSNDSIKLRVIVDNSYVANTVFGHGVVNATGMVFYSDTLTASQYSRWQQIGYNTCPNNTTTDIVVANTSQLATKFHYTVKRDIGTVKTTSGSIEIHYDVVADTVICYWDHLGDSNYDLGYDITADRSGTDIRLNIIVDNSTSNDLFFDERLISTMYE
jgi:hypothetical protein